MSILATVVRSHSLHATGNYMSRMRTLAIVPLLAATALLVPASAASAATRLVTSIVCDAETGVITTSISGNVFLPGPPQQVTVEFQRRNAANVTLAGRAAVPPLATPFKVTVTSTAAGDISATGYTGSFDPATSRYYQETVVVTARNAAGYGATRETTCRRDVRTTVTLTCDEAAGTVDAAVLGRDGQTGGTYDASGSPARVRYRTSTTLQHAPDEPRWVSGTLGDSWDFSQSVAPAADGTWANIAHIRTKDVTDMYYYAEETTVGVFNQWGLMVGFGVARCVLVDRSATQQG